MYLVKIFVPADGYSEVKQREHLRSDISNEQIADDGGRDGGIRCLAYTNKPSEKCEPSEALKKEIS